jgi:hypothetical protein
MSIPKSPPTVYTSSRQLIAGSDINNLSDHWFSFQTLVAAGATQATATAIDAANVEILTSAAAGVRLPVSYPGQEIFILNNSGQTQNVYPSNSDQVQITNTTTYAAAGVAATQANLTSYCYVCIKKGFWQRSIFTGA